MIILSLALGIGASTTVFSVVNGVLLQPTGWPEPERLVHILTTDIGRPGSRSTTSAPDYFDWKAGTTSFEDMALRDYPKSYTLTGGGAPERAAGLSMEPHLARMLGFPVARGRWMAEGEEGVVVISHSLWMRRFGGEQRALGAPLTINGRPHTVIGVTAASPRISNEDFYLPLVYADAESREHRGARLYQVAARLKHSVRLAQAQAEMDAITAAIRARHPQTNKDSGARVVTWHEDLVGGVRFSLWVLMGAVSLVLLIACANAGGLWMARASVRRRELAVRMALGAGRARLARQLLTESLVLAAPAGALGAVLASWSVDLLRALPESTLPRLANVELDGAVLAFTIAVTMLAGVASGIAPALLASHRGPEESLRGGDRTTAGSRSRAVVVAFQIALSVVLLAGASVLLRSLQRVNAVPLGFETERVISARTNLPLERYPKLENWERFHGEVLERLARLPGVAAAGAVNMLPLRGMGSVLFFQLPGMPPPEHGDFVMDGMRVAQ
ncbi:MAG: ABC transporter permease, partial [Bryobacteraceae bacterium]